MWVGQHPHILTVSTCRYLHTYVQGSSGFGGRGSHSPNFPSNGTQKVFFFPVSQSQLLLMSMGSLGSAQETPEITRGGDFQLPSSLHSLVSSPASACPQETVWKTGREIQREGEGRSLLSGILLEKVLGSKTFYMDLLGIIFLFSTKFQSTLSPVYVWSRHGRKG